MGAAVRFAGAVLLVAMPAGCGAVGRALGLYDTARDMDSVYRVGAMAKDFGDAPPLFRDIEAVKVSARTAPHRTDPQTRRPADPQTRTDRR